MVKTYLRKKCWVDLGVFDSAKLAGKAGCGKRRALRGQWQQPRYGVLRQFDHPPLASLGHAGIQGDGAFGKVNSVPCQASNLSGTEFREQGKDGVLITTGSSPM